MFIFSSSNVKEKLNKARDKFRAFEQGPPVWAIVVAGVVIWITMQALKAML